jgi:nucleoside-diphosphate-sugar epimerase
VTARPSSAFWQDRPNLVTGATGLLGSWLVPRLLDAGADVVCLVRYWVPQSELILRGFLNRVKVARGEVQDQGLMERVLVKETKSCFTWRYGVQWPAAATAAEDREIPEKNHCPGPFCHFPGPAPIRP